MRKILLDHGMTNLACEKCMFTLNLPNGLDVKAGTHVEDVLFSVNDTKLFTVWFETIRTDLNIEALEKVTRTGSDYMAIEVSHSNNYLFLSLRRYIEKALARYGSKSASQPTPRSRLASNSLRLICQSRLTVDASARIVV